MSNALQCTYTLNLVYPQCISVSTPIKHFCLQSHFSSTAIFPQCIAASISSHSEQCTPRLTTTHEPECISFCYSGAWQHRRLTVLYGCSTCIANCTDLNPKSLHLRSVPTTDKSPSTHEALLSPTVGWDAWLQRHALFLSHSTYQHL